MKSPQTFFSRSPDGAAQRGLGLKVPSRPLRLSRDLSKVPLERYRIESNDSRKWKSIARDRMALAEWLALHGDADGSRIYPSEASITRHFGWSRRKTFYLLGDLKALGLLQGGGLTSEHGTRVRRMNLPAFLGAGVQDSAGAGVQDSRAGVQSNVAPNRHLTDTKSNTKPRPALTVENGAQNRAAQTASSSPIPLSRTENRKLQPQQVEYVHVRRLIAGAKWHYKNSKASGISLDRASWKEDLKCWAVENEIPYDAESIEKALDHAERETFEIPGLAAVAGARR
jgi:hypothetical protein